MNKGGLVTEVAKKTGMGKAEVGRMSMRRSTPP